MGMELGAGREHLQRCYQPLILLWLPQGVLLRGFCFLFFFFFFNYVVILGM